MKQRMIGLSVLVLASCAAAAGQKDNLLANGDFSRVKDGKIVGWEVVGDAAVSVEPAAGPGQAEPGTPTSRSTGPAGQSLKAEVKRASGKLLGQVLQKVAVRPNTRYRLSGEIKADVRGMAVLQIKRIQDGKEIDRTSTGWNRQGWTAVERTFDSGSSAEVHVLCRFRQEDGHVGKAAYFASLRLVEAGELVFGGPEQGPTAVPTFNCVGLYWQPVGGSPARRCSVRYRAKGDAQWREAMPLWFDGHDHEGLPQRSREYRGSIVGLQSGREYEVELSLAGGGAARTLSFTTWAEQFKIARSVELPAERSETFVISEGGSERAGYVLYAPPAGKQGAWDAQGRWPVNVRVAAPYVVVRGLTLRNAGTHGIELGDVRHVVIEDCDISGWGRIRQSDGFGENLDSAIFCRSRQLEHVVIQRCRLHHPRSNSNSWVQKRAGGTFHPGGPQGISLRDGKGRYVIRYNRIESDLDHMFNDAMGEWHNFSYGGFPNRDSDVHGNYVSHCWDDGLEIEGANMNVRVWENYITMTFGAVGAASTSLGPAYYFRNVYAVSRKHGGTDADAFRGHFLIKLGSEPEQAEFSRGRKYFLHNTVLQPCFARPAAQGEAEAPSARLEDSAAGAQAGIVLTSATKRELNVVSRNNILQLRKPTDWAIRDPQVSPTNDFDYDLYVGQVQAVEGAESRGLRAVPQYDRAPDGRLWLRPGTPGHDAAERIPNFNDGFVGNGPDMGAVETGTEAPGPFTWPEFPPPAPADPLDSPRSTQPAGKAAGGEPLPPLEGPAPKRRS